MNKAWLIQRLERYVPRTSHDVEMSKRVMDFVNRTPNYFSRENYAGHVVGSAWVIDNTTSHVLLTHHAKLGKWLQLGGHVEETDATILDTAEREAKEESGLSALIAIDDHIYDIDIHEIPENKTVPSHTHFDIRFCFIAEMYQPLTVTHESTAVEWLPLAKVLALAGEDISLYRLADKLRFLPRT